VLTANPRGQFTRILTETDPGVGPFLSVEGALVSKRLAVVPVLAAAVALSFVGLAHAQSVVNMTAVEFAFQPATVQVLSSGAVTFNMRNDGQFPHNIQFDDQDNPVFPADLNKGESASATVTLAPGTYSFYCPVPGHRERGMVGTLTVVSAAQAARAGDLDPVLLPGALAALGALMLGGGWLRRRGVI
jgi:plastocyanin